MVWIAENDFGYLVRNHWNSLRGEENSSPMFLLVNKLISLKSVVIKWEKNHKKELKYYLCHIEEELEKLYSQNVCGVFNLQEKMLIKDLEYEKKDNFKEGGGGLEAKE